jgi:hypothetical protein
MLHFACQGEQMSFKKAQNVAQLMFEKNTLIHNFQFEKGCPKILAASACNFQENAQS